MKKNPAAVALGKLGRGKPKTLSPEERLRRSKSVAIALRARWPKGRKNQ